MTCFDAIYHNSNTFKYATGVLKHNCIVDNFITCCLYFGLSKRDSVIVTVIWTTHTLINVDVKLN